MRALFTCNELGLGHVSRSTLLGNVLMNRGHEVVFAAGGNAYKILKDRFEDVYYSTPVSWYETGYGVMPTTSVINIFLPLPLFESKEEKMKWKKSSTMETIFRYYDQRDVLAKIKADLIISDGDITSLRLAQRWRKPSVFITNVIQPNYGFPISFFTYPGQRLVERYIKNSDKIIIPDFPPPNTICEYSLGNFEQLGIKKKVRYVGPFINMSRENVSDEIIFASITGPLGSRERLKREIIPALSSLDHESVVSLGEPYNKYYSERGRCKIFSWLSTDTREEYMRRAKIFIIPGSHGTCFESIKYRKPSICIPTQIEQEANAVKLNELGCSLLVKSENELKLAIKKIGDEYDFFKNNVEKIRRYATKFNGLDTASDIIDELSRKKFT